VGSVAAVRLEASCGGSGSKRSVAGTDAYPSFALPAASRRQRRQLPFARRRHAAWAAARFPHLAARRGAGPAVRRAQLVRGEPRSARGRLPADWTSSPRSRCDCAIARRLTTRRRRVRRRVVNRAVRARTDACEGPQSPSRARPATACPPEGAVVVTTMTPGPFGHGITGRTWPPTAKGRRGYVTLTSEVADHCVARCTPTLSDAV
jgi:hypothetical protein